MWHALEGLCFALSMVAIYAVRCVTACISAFSSPPCHTQQCTAHSRLPVETRVMLSAGFSPVASNECWHQFQLDIRFLLVGIVVHGPTLTSPLPWVSKV